MIANTLHRLKNGFDSEFVTIIANRPHWKISISVPVDSDYETLDDEKLLKTFRIKIGAGLRVIASHANSPK